MLVASGLLGCAQMTPLGRSGGAIDALRDQLDQVVPELMSHFHVPGVAIAIVNSSGEMFVARYGYTDDSKRVPVDGATVFEAASLGKPLFCYAVLHRVGPPRFNADRAVAEYMGSPFAAETLAAKITGRQLLSHTSGLIFSELDQRRHVVVNPGSQWQYSGLGYSILQQAVERLWSKPLEDLVFETVTGPLGMANTSYVPPRGAQAILALGHDRQGRPRARTESPSASAASSLHTSASDYGRFVRVMLAGLRKNGDVGAAQMVEPQVEVDGDLSLYWGLGWALAKVDADTVFLHWGSNPGYKSLALGSMTQDVGMVVLTNADNGLEVATALVPVVFGRDYAFLKFNMLHPDD